MLFSSPSALEDFPAAPSLLGRVLVFFFYMLSPLLNLFCCCLSCSVVFVFFLCPRTERSVPRPLVLSLPTAFYSIGLGVPFVTMSPCLSLFSCHSLCLWLFDSCSVSPQFFFRRNCSINQCNLVCCREEVSSESSYVVILNPNVNCSSFWTGRAEVCAEPLLISVSCSP